MKNHLALCILVTSLLAGPILGQDRNISGRWSLDDAASAAAMGVTLGRAGRLPPPAPPHSFDLRLTLDANQLVVEDVANNDDAVMLKTIFRLDGSPTRVSGARPGIAVAHWRDSRLSIDITDANTGEALSHTAFYMDGDELVHEMSPLKAGDSPTKYDYYRRRQ